MARYAFALRGQVKDAAHEIRIDEQVIDIVSNREHLTEHFLCNVNANGEVPVLAWNESGKKLPDSVAITYCFAESYPSLIPNDLEGEIRSSLEELHRISFFALTFTGRPQGQEGNIRFLQDKLKDDINDRYRKAIEHKIQRARSSKLSQLEPQAVDAAITRTKEFLTRMERHLNKSNSGWVLNTSAPTALDAHLVVFVARLQDVKRENLIPDQVKAYVEMATIQSPWTTTMDGRRTVPNI